MISNEEIDQVLMANITDKWRKVALVVATTMSQLGHDRRIGRNDLYFAKRVTDLAERGVIEYDGDLNQMGRCEVRLPLKANDA